MKTGIFKGFDQILSLLILPISDFDLAIGKKVIVELIFLFHVFKTVDDNFKHLKTDLPIYIVFGVYDDFDPCYEF